MPEPANPPLDRFLSRLPDRLVWGQVLIRLENQGPGRTLRHVADEHAEPSSLREVTAQDLRRLAESTAEGGFRPLKSTPDLVRGWWCRVPTGNLLGEALDSLYPGSMADAWAAETGQPAARFEEVAARQLGRAGALRELTGAALGATIASACHPGACLKRRLWTADGHPPEGPDPRRPIPCLDPCPLFLGFARACTGTERSSTVAGPFAPDDLATLAAALRHALEHPPAGLRMGEVAAPLHPWRVARLLARQRETWSQATPPTADSDE